METTSERAGRRFLPRAPFHVAWLATNACNARCLHCSSSSACRSPDELNTAEVFHLLEDLARAGVADLAVSGGEPLLRHDLIPILTHARRLGFSIGVGSNGTTLTRKNAACLAELGIQRFQVSLDGLPASHDALRRWPGLFDRVLRAIEIAQDAGLRTHVCCTINRLNHHQLEPFVEKACELGVRRVNFSRYVPTGRGTDALDLSEAEWKAVIHLCTSLRDQYCGRLEIVTHLAQQILVDPEVVAAPGFVGCQAGIGQGCVTANGTVQPCVLLPIPLGNIRERPFADIWLSSPIVRALQARDELRGVCGRCRFSSRCGGCRAVAYAKTGDFLATDPRCWLVAESSTNPMRKEMNHGE